MATAGTPLSDLEGRTGTSDGDLVQDILAQMNIPTGAQQTTSQRIPPPMPQQTYLPPQASSTQPLTMDGRIPTSHIIGNEHPTPADFAAAMAGMGGQRAAEASLMGSPVGSMPGVVQPVYQPPSKNMYSRVMGELKIPFLVSLLFFLFSLPPIRVLVAHYLPQLIKQTGDFTVPGLLAVSSLVGITFWVLNNVVAPLLSL